MKTVRELLFQRHQHRSPDLERMTAQLLTDLQSAKTGESVDQPPNIRWGVVLFFKDFFHMRKGFWLSMAGCWGLVLILQLVQAGTRSVYDVSNQPLTQPTLQVQKMLEEQNRMKMELLETTYVMARRKTETRPSAVPGPQSKNVMETIYLLT